MNDVLILKQNAKEVLKINTDHTVEFMGLKFDKNIVNSLLKNESVLLSPAKEGWYVNNKFVCHEDFIKVITSHAAKGMLANCDIPTIEELFNMLKN